MRLVVTAVATSTAGSRCFWPSRRTCTRSLTSPDSPPTMSAVLVILLLALAVGTITVGVVLPMVFVRRAVPFSGTSSRPTTGSTSAGQTTQSTQATTQGPTAPPGTVVSVINEGAQVFQQASTDSPFNPPLLVSRDTTLAVLERATDGEGAVFLRVRRCGAAPTIGWIEEIDTLQSRDVCA